MTRLSLSRTFVRNFTSQIADPEKNNIWKTLEFEGKFKTFPQNDDMRTELERIQKEKGLHGFLDHVMVDCKLLKPTEGIELTNELDEEISVIDWVKSDITVQQDAVFAFWEVVNKGVEEKNSRKSRSR